MSEPKKIVIVGAGLAGATAAGTLRERGYAGEILLLGTDKHRPYELPPLSKGLLMGTTSTNGMTGKRSAPWSMGVAKATFATISVRKVAFATCRP